MPASLNHDSRDSLPLDSDGYPRGETLASIADATALEALPKARKKRQRPTFEDGAISRVFKFPSKTNPRSSYYVTGTEIIIRIKKARKKRKLIIPKKRLVSYRTNRWFAKPRWVEIELTYTQALKLGLIEPRLPAQETSGAPTEARPADAEVVDLGTTESDFTGDGDTASDAELEGTQAVEDIDLDAGVDEPDAIEFPAATSEELCVAGQTGGDWHDPSTPDAASVVAPEYAVACQSVLTIDAGTGMTFDLDPQGAARSATPPQLPRSRTISASLLMALIVVVAGSTATWFTLGNGPDARIVDGAASPRFEPTDSSTMDIVTGSIATIDKPLLPAPGTTTDSEAQASPAVAVTKQPDFGAQEVPTSAIGPTERHDDMPEAAPHIAHDDAASDNQGVPPGGQPLEPQGLAIIEPDCRDLEVAAQSIRIQFDYAKSSLDRAALASLNDFAGRLRSCPSGMVIIEGHSDSDGDTHRNQAVSARRAQVVWRKLVDAGARPDRLSIIGMGPSRPYVPNVSAENKHMNRRAVLVVEFPR